MKRRYLIAAALLAAANPRAHADAEVGIHLHRVDTWHVPCSVAGAVACSRVEGFRCDVLVGAAFSSMTRACRLQVLAHEALHCTRPDEPHPHHTHGNPPGLDACLRGTVPGGIDLSAHIGRMSR